MRIVDPGHEILSILDGKTILKQIEVAGRTCYKSENRITEESGKTFVKRLIISGHYTVIEHVNITVKFTCDRGISHELVRHRLASYSQESTRYANYSKDRFGKEITVIRPLFWPEGSQEYVLWKRSMEEAERTYLQLIELGARPEQARSVLPNSLKTEIVATCNLREWRHIMNLRCSESAHPQMRQIMLPLLANLQKNIPVVFDDLYAQYKGVIQS